MFTDFFVSTAISLGLEQAKNKMPVNKCSKYLIVIYNVA
jgi:hypothetical protein